MDQKAMGELIGKYVDAYNTFDVDMMMSLMHESIVFENYSNDEKNLKTTGLTQLREVAKQAVSLFSYRFQTVTHMEFNNDEAVVDIEFEGKLAVDFSGDLKAGDTLQMPGKSIFRFKDGKISFIADYS